MTTARLLGAWFDSSMVLGVAWGTTLAAIGRHLPRKPTRGSVVVQLNGAANQRSTGVEYAGSLISRFASAFEASVHFFPVPAFFDYPETRAAMWRERSVVRVLEMQQRCDIALFSVGAFGGEMPSHVYSAGYLDRDDVAELSRQGVVGDVCTVFLREDGTSEDLAQLRRIPRRVCAVAGDGKVAALRAALLAGVITHLIVDEQTATRLAEAM
jgi:DNA-binding transcriptional regulator LsrR (DeoR family)